MSRRFLLAAFLPAISAADNLRNDLCDAANEFHEPYVAWANRMNEPHSPGTVQAGAVDAFQPLPHFWRVVERKFRAWIRGY